MTSVSELNGDNWELACSDDEIANAGREENGAWAPDPAELEALYSTIEKTGTLPLDWRCPGRRAPSPVRSNEVATPEIDGRMNRDTVEEKSDFDFMDEVSSLRLRVRREGEDTLRGSAKKKTTSFDGVLSNMYRHKRIEQMEKEGSGYGSTSPT